MKLDYELADAFAFGSVAMNLGANGVFSLRTISRSWFPVKSTDSFFYLTDVAYTVNGSDSVTCLYTCT